MRVSKRILFLLPLFIACQSNQREASVLGGDEILSLSIDMHDPQKKWDKAEVNLHIQEPRVSNPKRFTLLKLNNRNETFELSRNRENHLSTHIIREDGKSMTLLDGKEEIDSALVKKYRLQTERNEGYKNFYSIMYGVPMSLKASAEKISNVEMQNFNNQECYKVSLELKDAIISKYWIAYISKTSKKMIGLEIVFPDQPEKGERLYFAGNIEVDGMNLPRIRHWHEFKDDSYSGTDVIVKELGN